MPKTLGETLKSARNEKELSLRNVEEMTGIHNAHLSQVENDTISRPDMAMLWVLASLYELDYESLLLLAGYKQRAETSGRQRKRMEVAMRAMGELTPNEQTEVLGYMAKLKSQRAPVRD